MKVSTIEAEVCGVELIGLHENVGFIVIWDFPFAKREQFVECSFVSLSFTFRLSPPHFPFLVSPSNTCTCTP